MARRPKRWKGNIRPLSDEEMFRRFANDLDNLEVLCEDFDKGERDFLSFYMAEHLKRMLVDGSFATKVTGLVYFPTAKFEENPANIALYSRVTGFACWNGGVREKSFGTYVSRFVGKNYGPIEFLKFSTWWNQIILRRGGFQIHDGKPSQWTTRKAMLTPYFQREALTRAQLIHMVRDNYVAHQPSELPTVLELLDGPWAIGVDITVQIEDGTELSALNGTLPWKVGQLAAAIRQIAEETLIAFGRRGDDHFLPKK